MIELKHLLNSIYQFYSLGGFILLGVIVTFSLSKYRPMSKFKKIHFIAFLVFGIIGFIALVSLYYKVDIKDTAAGSEEGIIEYFILLADSTLYSAILIFGLTVKLIALLFTKSNNNSTTQG